MSKLWNLCVITTPELAEAIDVLLAGDALSVSRFAPPRSGLASIEALFDNQPDMDVFAARLEALAYDYQTELPEATLSEVPDIDWLKKVVADFPPQKIARWTIHSSEHRNAVKDRSNALQIDAVSAFGTGDHPTTRGCLIFLDDLLKETKGSIRNALDIGCGSGILAMAFAQATHHPAIAVDCDPDAVSVATENATINGVDKLLTIVLAEGTSAPEVQSAAPYDLILSNIFADPLCALAPAFRACLSPEGYVILAGILTSQADQVIDAYRAQGIVLREKKDIGEWTILALRHSPHA